MTDEGAKLLSRIAGCVDGLLTAPLCGRYTGDVLDRVETWGAVYGKTGLQFGRCHADTAVLRQLTADGYLVASGGQTKASAHRLTWLGLMSTTTATGPHETLLDLEVLCELAGAGDLVPGYALCPAACRWIRGGAPDAYKRELDAAAMALSPMMAMNWVSLLTDTTGRLWSVVATESGRAALANPPDRTIQPGTIDQFEDWKAGFDDAARFAAANPPAWATGYVGRKLSSGAGWSGIPTDPGRLYDRLQHFAGVAGEPISDSTTEPGEQKRRKTRQKDTKNEQTPRSRRS